MAHVIPKGFREVCTPSAIMTGETLAQQGLRTVCSLSVPGLLGHGHRLCHWGALSKQSQPPSRSKASRERGTCALLSDSSAASLCLSCRFLASGPLPPGASLEMAWVGLKRDH